MYTVDNQKIGQYLKELIENSRYGNSRQFCIAYLTLRYGEDNFGPGDIQNMQNRISQINNGKKGIQLEDLPFFSELLGVSIDAILSAGTFSTPVTNRLTNYSIAFSSDSAQWESYIKREDKLILNEDEYGKTVIDYALEAGNYSFLKYLMDNGYIWFVSEDSNQYIFSFGAGTSIERRLFDYDILDIRMRETDELRYKMITLAIKNTDFDMFDMLEKLRAREIPLLYNLATFHHSFLKDFSPPTKSIAQMIDTISLCKNDILSYFFEEFEINPNRSPLPFTFVFPYASLLLDALINRNRKAESKRFLEMAIKHNKKTFDLLTNLTAKSEQYFKYLYEKVDKFITYSDGYFDREIWRDYVVYPQLHFVAYHMPYSVKDSTGFVTNIFKVTTHSSDKEIQLLIDELNQTYDAFVKKEECAHARTNI